VIRVHVQELSDRSAEPRNAIPEAVEFASKRPAAWRSPGRGRVRTVTRPARGAHSVRNVQR
jgi:hypothetical protein